jgi:hypothetical protein
MVLLVGVTCINSFYEKEGKRPIGRPKRKWRQFKVKLYDFTTGLNTCGSRQWEILVNFGFLKHS